jgi:hypothetical protein
VSRRQRHAMRPLIRSMIASAAHCRGRGAVGAKGTFLIARPVFEYSRLCKSPALPPPVFVRTETTVVYKGSGNPGTQQPGAQSLGDFSPRLLAVSAWLIHPCVVPWRM